MNEKETSQDNISISVFPPIQSTLPKEQNNEDQTKNDRSLLIPSRSSEHLNKCLGLKSTKKWEEYKLLLFYNNPIWRTDINEENMFSIECEGFTENKDHVCDKCMTLTQNRSFTSAMANVKRRLKNNPDLDSKKPIMPVGSKNLTPSLRMIKDQITRPILCQFQEQMEKMKNDFESDKDKIQRENKSLGKQIEKI